jgi:flagellar hook-basal body complex protein FliE
MTVPAAAAASAYANVARLADPAAALGKGAGGGDAAGGQSFGNMLSQALNSVVDAGHKSDVQSKAMVAGKADMVDVVTAVSETEVAVETMVSVRDKVIEAYQSIMQMTI